MDEKLGGNDSAGKCGNLVTFVGANSDVSKVHAKVEIGGKETNPLELNTTIKIENTLKKSQTGSIKVTINGETLNATDILSKNKDSIKKPEDVAVVILSAEPITREMMDENYFMYGKPGETKGGYEYDNTIYPWQNRKDYVLVKQDSIASNRKQKYILRTDIQGIIDYHWMRKDVSWTKEEFATALGNASAGLAVAGLILFVIGTVGTGGILLVAAGSIIQVARVAGTASTAMGVAHVIFKEKPTVFDAMSLGHASKIKAMNLLLKEASVGFDIISTVNGLIITGIGVLSDKEKERVRNEN